MVRLAASFSILLMLGFLAFSSGLPISLEEDNAEEKVPQTLLNELHIWDDEPLNNSADIVPFNPKPVDTTLNCPSCLPDALLVDTHQW